MSLSPVSDATLNPDEPTKQPTNLLVTFLEYSSIVMQDTKGKDLYHNRPSSQIGGTAWYPDTF